MAKKVIVNGLNIGYIPPTYSDEILYTRGGGISTKEAIDNKVDKEQGKGLFSGSYNDLTDKPTIQTYTAGDGLGIWNNSFHITLPRVTESCNSLPGVAKARFREYNATSADLPSPHFYHIIEMASQDRLYGTQLALGMTVSAVYYRQYNNGSWNSWHKLTMS